MSPWRRPSRTDRSRRRFGALVALAGAFAGCSPESQPQVGRASLAPGVVASVAGEPIHAASVTRIASARGVDLRRARELAVRDALFAAAVRADPERGELVNVAERAELARRLLEELERRASDAGPPSDAEIAALTAERWTELDRPVSVRTTHAVVLVDEPEQRVTARALAARLAGELRGTTSSDEFVRKAKDFDAKPLELRAERLSPVTSDGRVWEPGAPLGTELQTYDPEFARAAHALATPGDHSPVVETQFGYHVILLEERIPEVRLSLGERRLALHDEVLSRRAKLFLSETLTRLRAMTPVETSRAADGLTALVTPAAP